MTTNPPVSQPDGEGPDAGLSPEDMSDDELVAARRYHDAQAARFSNEAAKIWRLLVRTGNAAEPHAAMEAARLERRAAMTRAPSPDSIAEKARRVVDGFSDWLRTGDGDLDSNAVRALTAIVAAEFGGGVGGGNS